MFLARLATRSFGNRLESFMIRNNLQAAEAAEARTRNIENTCQIVTRGYYGAPSVGDFDGDGAADAEDGWKAEPIKGRHPGDRNPPRGFPVSWGGGSSDNGHRAIALGNGLIRSTDAPKTGITSTVPLEWVEENWGLPYLGWSETISGILIPRPDKPVTRITEARQLCREARELAKSKDQRRRVRRISAGLSELPWK